MEEDGMDERFKKVLTDPRFKRLPNRKKKIKIDSRFEGMFDKRFNGEPLIDKRGRKVQNTKNDGLKRFYEINEEKNQEEEDEEVEDKEKPNISDIARKLRGEDNDEDSSSSDESSSEEEEEDDDDNDGPSGDHETGTIDQVESEVPRTEEITCRFAVTNVDWDRLKAVDLFVLLNSFKPNEGEIVSVKIYPSQFGKERMEKEKLEGPKELTDVKLDEDEEDPYQSTINDTDEIINTDIPFVSEKLRRYQINRLKYFYAVVECDTPETAVALYDQLDGMEYESSASTLDLRFIPDGMSFDEDEPDSVCYEMPSLIDYNPPHFITTALQQTKVNLTWDETDPNRAKTLQRAFTERDKISDDLACYLASSSSEEDDDDNDDGDNFNQNASEEEDSISLEGKSVQDRINRYKDLLKNVEEEEAADDEKDIDMEIKWEPELENIGKKIVEKKKKNSMTIFEKQMAERKAKRKEIGTKKKSSSNEIDSGDDDEDEDDDDQEENSDENNEDYESEDDNVDNGENESDDNNESDEDNSDKDDGEDGQGVGKDDLALLVMDNEKKDKKHFNYDNFVENKKSKRKKKRKEKNKQLEEDNFEFDEEDPRFKAIYNSHLYNIDQSSSHFKKTQAYDKILKRKASKDPDHPVKRSK